MPSRKPKARPEPPPPAAPTPTRPAAARQTFVALLRGLNVGGKNRLNMADLAALFDLAGATNVRTYIQSGNVVFDAPAKTAPALVVKVADLLTTKHGLRIPIIIRSTAQMAAVAASDAFDQLGAAPPARYIAFLAFAPTPALIKALDPNRSPGDTFLVRDQEIYLNLATGAARSKLTTTWLDSALKTTSTVRNERTVQQLAAMAQAAV